MEDNPYQKLAEILNQQPREGDISGALQLGKVLSAPSEESPGTALKVSVAGTVQDPDDLSKNAVLSERDLAAGDRVLLLPVDQAQRYIILCKVVSV